MLIILHSFRWLCGYYAVCYNVAMITMTIPCQNENINLNIIFKYYHFPCTPEKLDIDNFNITLSVVVWISLCCSLITTNISYDK